MYTGNRYHRVVSVAHTKESEIERERLTRVAQIVVNEQIYLRRVHADRVVRFSAVMLHMSSRYWSQGGQQCARS